MTRLRTGYSFRVGYGHLPDVMSRLVEIGSTVAPISDRMSTFGFNRFTKLAKKAGLKPIYGVELACVTELGAAKPSPDYWTFFAKDELRPLHDLIWQATNNPGKEPSLLYKQALAAPGVFKVAGERLQVDALPESPPHDFYMALSPSTPKGLVSRALKRGIPMLASCDNYYPRETDLEFYRIAMGWRGGTQTYPRHIMSNQELESWLLSAGNDSVVVASAFFNRRRVEDRCVAVMKQAKMVVPERPCSLRELCLEGASRLGVDLDDPVYKARLNRELLLIEEKEFENYFFVLADMISWAKERMIVGPARGSSCGSLVCYLIGITAIDPIPFGLVFERFIDLNRGGWRFKKELALHGPFPAPAEDISQQGAG